MRKGLKFQTLKVEHWRACVPEVAFEAGKHLFRRKGRKVAYRAVALNALVCVECEGIVEDVPVRHRVISTYEGSSEGDYYERVPHCPNCEGKPRSIGRPILTRENPDGLWKTISSPRRLFLDWVEKSQKL